MGCCDNSCCVCVCVFFFLFLMKKVSLVKYNRHCCRNMFQIKCNIYRETFVPYIPVHIWLHKGTDTDTCVPHRIILLCSLLTFQNMLFFKQQQWSSGHLSITSVHVTDTHTRLGT